MGVKALRRSEVEAKVVWSMLFAWKTSSVLQTLDAESPRLAGDELILFSMINSPERRRGEKTCFALYSTSSRSPSNRSLFSLSFLFRSRFSFALAFAFVLSFVFGLFS